MPVFPIPNDWDGETWACFITEWPDSLQWLGILRGMMTTAQRGRFWDGSTGSIIDAQAIGLEIAERNPVTTCEDMIIALQGIQVAVENLDVSQDTQVTIQTSIANNVNAVSSAVANLQAVLLSASISQANSYAWSTAFAESTQSIYVINNVPAQLRPIEPTIEPPPTSEETTETGITSTPASTVEAEICKRAFWMAFGALRSLKYLKEVRSDISQSTLGILGGLADSLGVGAIASASAPKPFIIPASILLQVAHLWFSLVENGLFDAAFQALVDYYEEQLQPIVCAIYEGTLAENSTLDIQVDVVSVLLGSAAAGPAVPIVKLWLNLNTLATMYYDTGLIGTLPAIPVEYVDICDECIGV